MLEKIIFNDAKNILTSDLVWLCAYCHTCYERCPQRVGLSHVFMDLKNLAANKGNVPEELAKEALQLIRTGWIVPSSPVIERRRVEMKLPPISQVNVEEIQTITKATGFLNLIPEAKKYGGSKSV
jgi:heterodisulfide reductase subunit C